MKSDVRVILCGGLVAGTLDLSAAFISSWLRAGVGPVRVMQSIASGLLGAAAFTGGAGSAALGVALHFLIATVATAVFYFASRTLRFLVEHAITAGLFYGVAVYAFMNFVVIPLSAVPRRGGPRSLVGTHHWPAHHHVLRRTADCGPRPPLRTPVVISPARCR